MTFFEIVRNEGNDDPRKPSQKHILVNFDHVAYILYAPSNLRHIAGLLIYFANGETLTLRDAEADEMYAKLKEHA